MDHDTTLIKEIDRDFLWKKGFCGLKNLNNTCFMNSILQCLSNTELLLKFIFSNKFSKSLNLERDETDLIIEFKKLLIKLWEKNNIFSPNKFLEELQSLSSIKGRDEFTGFGQNDSQEFLQFLLEMLHTCLAREVSIEIEGIVKNSYDKFAIKAYKSFKSFFENEYSEIVSLFYGQFFTKLEIATEDKRETNYSFEPFSMLSLNIPEEDATLYSCLDDFVKGEDIINTSKKHIKKTVYFWSLPDVLIIFLKRYNNNMTKIETVIDFPIDTLDMEKYVRGYDRSSYKYSLYAISNHGGGLGGGHYWSYVKNLDDNWYKFNDSVVTTLPADNLVSDKAYCLFYKKDN